jgi:hypothetical protein
MLFSAGTCCSALRMGAGRVWFTSGRTRNATASALPLPVSVAPLHQRPLTGVGPTDGKSYGGITGPVVPADQQRSGARREVRTASSS